MTQSQSTKEPAVAEGLPVAQLREVLKTVDDNALMKFLYNYSIGAAAEQFVGIMVEQDQRAAFFVTLARAYPEDWNRAVEILSKG